MVINTVQSFFTVLSVMSEKKYIYLVCSINVIARRCFPCVDCGVLLVICVAACQERVGAWRLDGPRGVPCPGRLPARASLGRLSTNGMYAFSPDPGIESVSPCAPALSSVFASCWRGPRGRAPRRREPPPPEDGGRKPASGPDPCRDLPSRPDAGRQQVADENPLH